MNILFLIGSPRKKSSASCYFARILKFFLTLGSFGKIKVEIAEIPPKAAPDIMAKLAAADKVVIFTPLYCDGMPSHVISFLQQAEIFCKQNPCNFDFYAVCNNGFIEGRQNEACLNQYQCFCQKTGVNGCGGMGIGGGGKVHFLAKVYPFVFLFFIVLHVLIYFLILDVLLLPFRLCIQLLLESKKPSKPRYLSHLSQLLSHIYSN